MLFSSFLSGFCIHLSVRLGVRLGVRLDLRLSVRWGVRLVVRLGVRLSVRRVYACLYSLIRSRTKFDPDWTILKFLTTSLPHPLENVIFVICIPYLVIVPIFSQIEAF